MEPQMTPDEGHQAEDEKEARWALARQIADELAAEVGVTEEDKAWARSVLGLDDDDDE